MTLVGTNVPMAGALAKITGAVNYIANLEFPGQLFAKALRSPYPHAKLIRIDAGKATTLPGVRAVVTRDDLSGLNPHFGTGVEDQAVVVIDKVRYVGDIVAAVAADSREIAEEAIALIDAEYEELPAVTDILEAVKPAAPIIHGKHVDKAAGGNIHGVYRAASGDIEQGFRESDEIIENTYTLPPLQHGHIEPHAVTAFWDPSGRLVVHSPCQTPSSLHEQLARVFKLPLNRVRVIVPPVGGGYGGKNHARIEPVVALLARKARRPVQWVLTRDEVFLTGRRFAAVVKMKTGFKRDGRLWARKVQAYYDMGAYALSGPANTKNACIIAGGPFPQLFRAIFGDPSGSLFGNHTVRTEGGVDAKTGQGKGSSFWFCSAAGAEVEVDTETGKVHVLKVFTAVDVGKAIHPLQCDLQNEGSALAGLGSALFEEIRFDNGQPINATFFDYLLPSMLDHPGEFDSLLVETPHLDGPFGAKGMGEAGLPPMAPAIGNAIANALGGMRVRDLPIKPDKIVAALGAAKETR